jgi:hypothetical protein
LATSLQKLKNAWDEFLMGLSNNEILKFAVDSLTTILTSINKLVDGISGGNGLVKSLTSLIGVLGALKLGRNILGDNGITNIFSRLSGKTEKFSETITETKNEKGDIVRTIVRQP